MPRVEIQCIAEHERIAVEQALSDISNAIIHEDIELELVPGLP